MPLLPHPSSRKGLSVTEALRELRQEVLAQIPELERTIEELRIRRAAEQKRKATSFALAFWITGNTDPLSLDFSVLETEADPTKLDLLRRLGRQFRFTGARVAID